MNSLLSLYIEIVGSKWTFCSLVYSDKHESRKVYGSYKGNVSNDLYRWRLKRPWRRSCTIKFVKPRTWKSTCALKLLLMRRGVIWKCTASWHQQVRLAKPIDRPCAGVLCVAAILQLVPRLTPWGLCEPRGEWARSK